MNFRNANHLTEISGNFHVQSCTEKKLPGKFFENLSIPREVVLFNFMEIFENAGLFATGSSRKFNNRHEPGFWWNEKRPIFPFEIGSVFEF